MVNDKRCRTEWLSFEDARELVRLLELKTIKEYLKCKILWNKLHIVPSCPNQVYKDKWISWRDWLGTEKWSFEEARLFARKLKISSANAWRKYAISEKRPCNMPVQPKQFYGDEKWVSWEDWLDVENHLKKQFLPFEEARKYARALQLKSQGEWFRYCSSKRPENIPCNPNQVYRNKGWISWGDWLASGNIHPNCKKFRAFKDARTFVRKLELKGVKQWGKYRRSGKKPNDIPSCPYRIYDEEWIDFYDWLGKERIYGKLSDFLPFEKARDIARTLGIKTLVEWRKEYALGKIPKNLPCHPEVIYKKSWITSYDWLGTENPHDFLPFEEARDFARKLKLKSMKEWRRYHTLGKIPNIPYRPSLVYKECWISSYDWLDKEKKFSGVKNKKSQGFTIIEVH